MPADELFEMVNTLLHGRFGIAQALMHGTRVSGTRTVTERWRVQPHVQQPEDSDDVVRINTVAHYFIETSYTMPLYGTDSLGMELLTESPQKPTNQFTPEQLEQFKTCLRETFQVEYRDHKYEREGEAYFKGYSNLRKSWSFYSIGDFKVTTDQWNYSSEHLKTKYNKLGVGIRATGNVWGYTDPRSPYVNAIANDAGIELKGNEFLGLWVFELGNALNEITRRELQNELQPGQNERYDGLNEAGVSFEDCVFGGRLNSDGSVTPFRK